MSAQPMDILLDYAKRSREHAESLPTADEAQTNWNGVGFDLLGSRVVAPLGQIVEVLPVPKTTRIPAVQPWVMGVANVRGQLLPLFSLPAFFGGKLSSSKSQHRVLVLHMGDIYIGLVVNAVYGMQFFPDTAFRDTVTSVADNIKPYVDGLYDMGEEEWAVFKPYFLTRDARFFSAAVNG